MPQLKLIQGRKSGELKQKTAASPMVEMLSILASEIPPGLRLTRLQFKRIQSDWQTFMQGNLTPRYSINIFGEAPKQENRLALREFVKQLDRLGILTRVTFLDNTEKNSPTLYFKLEGVA